MSKQLPSGKNTQEAVRSYASICLTGRKVNEDERATLILFSGDLDKAMAAFTIANGAAGQGLEVYMYFTFWGLALLRKETGDGTLFLEKMFKRMMPVGPEQAGLSQMNFAGAGSSLIKMLMDQKAATLYRLNANGHGAQYSVHRL